MGTKPKDAKAIFLAAVEMKSAQERGSFLDEACAGDTQLRRRVEELLSSFEEAGSFMEKKPGATFAPTVNYEQITERAGSVIGPYKLLQQIGEGGFGVVFMAEQREPVRRKVALKVIKPGMDTKEVVARFEAERQALALMDHPNIARVFDAGATDSGRPYFVMELVKGVPITEYCDKNNLLLHGRLELFVTTCHAVQHAHQKGVIHRDIKPNNIMVTLHDGKPVPKVIDFGVAKATSQRLTEKTLFTAYGQVIGTPTYMSPEQAEMSGLDIDTRSDIYALGVLLYELLTGRPPFDAEELRRAGYEEMLRIICEKEPIKPSTRLSTMGEELTVVSNHRGIERRKLGQLVKGDLDWIVMKALEKERNRRYETPNAFAEDIERHLKHEPVEACPPSSVYKFHKFVRRNTVAFATATGILFLLLSGTVVSTWQAVRATRAEQAAEIARQNETAQREMAESQRNEALAAHEMADRQRNHALIAREQAQDSLARSLFHQAQAVRRSQTTGRRWTVLELLGSAEELRSRERGEEPSHQEVSDDTDLATVTALSASEQLTGEMPTRADLRTEAVAALALEDARPVPLETVGIMPAVSHDGGWAVALSEGSEPTKTAIVLSDLRADQEVRRWEDLGMIGVLSKAVSPDGQWLAAVSGTGSIELRDLSTPVTSKTVLKLPPQPNREDKIARLRRAFGERTSALGSITRFTDLEFSPDGRLLAATRIPATATAGFDMTQLFAKRFGKKEKDAETPVENPLHQDVVVWDLDDLEEPLVLESQLRVDVGGVFTAAFGSQRRFAFAPDGKQLAYQTADKKIAIISLDGQSATDEIEFPLPIAGGVDFGAGGRLLSAVCRAEDGPESFVVLWNVPEKVEQVRFNTAVQVPFPIARFSPDGNQIAVATGRREITIFNVTDESVAFRLFGADASGVFGVHWDISGRQLFSWGPLGKVVRWELSNSPILSAIPTQGQRISSFAFSPDGELLASSNGTQLSVQSIDGGRRSATHQYPSVSLVNSVIRLFFSADSRRIAEVGFKQAVVWDVETGHELARSAEQSGFADYLTMSAAFGPNGRLLVSGMSFKKRNVPVWDIAADKEVGQFPGIMGFLSPDGRLLANVPFKMPMNQIDVRQVADDKTLAQFTLETGGVGQVTISPDGRWLAAVGTPWGGQLTVTSLSGQAAQTVTIFGLDDGEQRAKILGSSQVTSLAFSPDGRLIAVGLASGAVRIWDIDRGQEVFRWQAHSIPVAKLAFTPDGQAIATVDGQSTEIQLLDLEVLRRELAQIGLDW